MARIKLTLPSPFSFSTQIPVRITDVNYGGHVGNDSVLGLLHEIRMQFLNHLGYSEMDFGGVSLIMSDVAIEFKNELYYGDTIKAHVTATELSRVGFDLYYKLIKVVAEKEIIIALAKTGMVCFNYTTKKVVAIPDAVRQVLPA